MKTNLRRGMTIGKQSVLSKQLSESQVGRAKDHNQPPPHLKLIIVAVIFFVIVIIIIIIIIIIIVVVVIRLYSIP